MTEFSLKIKSSKEEDLALRVFESPEFDRYILFIHGGATDVGKDRFKDWQKDFSEDGVGSVSFDFVGVGESLGDVSQESLSKRLSDTKEVLSWMMDRYPEAEIAIFGVSMGGYIALGLVSDFSEAFDRLIIQVPAAYSLLAHDLKFDETFTEELRREGSWKDSMSFNWWGDYTGRKLLIACREDKTIPREIIDTYKIIGDKGGNFDFLDIDGAPHNIWKAEVDKEKILSEAYNKIKRFLLN